MDEPFEPLFESKPRGYAPNSDVEAKSRNLVQYLLNPSFVRNEIRVNDKYPNFDGILDLTEEDGTPIGHILVQCKTLSVASLPNPGYSCDEPFMAACDISQLPVILLVADHTNERVYWRYIDLQTMLEFKQNRTGKNYKLGLQHYFDKEDQSYIIAWQLIVRSDRRKLRHYDFVADKLKQTELQYEELRSNLRPATDLDATTIRDLQVFLDQYNYVLERQFPGVKEILYEAY